MYISCPRSWFLVPGMTVSRISISAKHHPSPFALEDLHYRPFLLFPLLPQTNLPIQATKQIHLSHIQSGMNYQQILTLLPDVFYFKRSKTNLNYSPIGKILGEEPAVHMGVVVIKELGRDTQPLFEFSHLDFSEGK